ncbi:MAG: hypothetical protein KatS3mg118_0867 [Paracoccaceae bacterium]|nr:MAG: hypothetical protein KatS3mg118_0867 [Paracoccaceae bacterium]
MNSRTIAIVIIIIAIIALGAWYFYGGTPATTAPATT